jgi:hypothetical protein
LAASTEICPSKSREVLLIDDVHSTGFLQISDEVHEVPLDLAFLPKKLKFLKSYINFSLCFFWHFIVLHLAALQIQTILLNLDKSLDETMDYIMIGSIYIFGYFILIFWQVNSKKLLRVYDFVHENFRQRSMRGEMIVLDIFEVIEVLELNNSQAQLSWTSTKL